MAAFLVIAAVPLSLVLVIVLARPVLGWIRSLFSKQTGLAAARWTRRLLGRRPARREPGASPLLEKLAAIPCCAKPGGAPAECAVCISAVDVGDEIRELRCRHVFHRGCLDEWVDYGKDTCPLCRVPLFPAVGEADDEDAPDDVDLPFSAFIHSCLLRW
ncbi:uncharacterized protein LOC144708432 [Wolffia australiana]